MYITVPLDSGKHVRFTSLKNGAKDGVHPTTVFSGLMAQRILETMIRTGVKTTTGEVPVLDREAIIAADKFIQDPPVLLCDLKKLSGVLNHLFFSSVEKNCFSHDVEADIPFKKPVFAKVYTAPNKTSALDALNTPEYRKP